MYKKFSFSQNHTKNFLRSLKRQQIRNGKNIAHEI